MSDKYVVLDLDAFADECMTRDLAAFSDRGVFLDFDKRADLRLVPNFTPVEIDEFGKLDALSKLNVRSNRAVFVHRRTNSPLFWMDCSAASSIRTTRRPAWPSLNGVLLWRMQSAK